MKKILSIFCALCMSAIGFAQTTDVNVVRQFGSSLSNWASSRNTFSALESMERLCSKFPAFRVGDNIMTSLASKNNLTRTDTYDWDMFISCIQKEVDKGVTITFSDIKQVPESMISKNYKDVQYVSCNVKMSGSSNFNESDLFVLKSGKIVKIQEYEVIIDKKGRRRIHVDLSGMDLDDEQEGFGLTYNYSKAFPVGASIYYTKWKMMIGADFGINLDNDLYTTQKNEFNNLMDYKITKGEFDPKFYLTITPAFYMKYFSIGWGFGVLSLKGKEVTDQRSYQENEDGSIVVTTGSSQSDMDKTKFMMRPNIKGFIPCNDNFFISLSVSYNWIPGYKTKSGIDFGIGFQYLID